MSNAEMLAPLKPAHWLENEKHDACFEEIQVAVVSRSLITPAHQAYAFRRGRQFLRLAARRISFPKVLALCPFANAIS